MVSGKRLGKCGGLAPGEADSHQPPQAELRRGHLISFEVADNTNSMATYGILHNYFTQFKVTGKPEDL